MGRSLTRSAPQPGLPSGLRPEEGQGLGPTRRVPQSIRSRAWPVPTTRQSPEGLAGPAARCCLPSPPLGAGSGPSESPCCTHRVEGRAQAHLPHEVLDAAQLALDAGSVQQGLPHIVAPVPLWAQAPQDTCVLGAEAEGPGHAGEAQREPPPPASPCSPAAGSGSPAAPPPPPGPGTGSRPLTAKRAPVSRPTPPSPLAPTQPPRCGVSSLYRETSSSGRVTHVKGSLSSSQAPSPCARWPPPSSLHPPSLCSCLRPLLEPFLVATMLNSSA